MLIYGSKLVHLKSTQLRTAACPNCGTEGALTLSAYRRHVHLFWIPMFPIGKRGRCECGNCQRVFKIKELPEAIKKQYLTLKDDTEGPLWQFAGLGLLAVLISWAMYASGEDKKMELAYIADPAVGDVYEYKIETGKYSTLKITSISQDSVFVAPNDYEINKVTRIYQIDKPENYADFSYGISIEELQEMYNTDEIIDIKRK